MCVDTCPPGAISLDENEGVAAINLALCDNCLACLDVCPNDAIQRTESAERMPVLEGEVVEGEVVGSEVIPAPVAGLPITNRRSGQLAALAGTTLTFLGSWLLPRVADVLEGAVERRLARGVNSTPSATPVRPGSNPLVRHIGGRRDGRSRQRRRHRRGG